MEREGICHAPLLVLAAEPAPLPLIGTETSAQCSSQQTKDATVLTGVVLSAVAYSAKHCAMSSSRVTAHEVPSHCVQ